MQLFFTLAPDITQAILSTGSIVGIVVAALAGILGVVIILVVFCCVSKYLLSQRHKPELALKLLLESLHVVAIMC